MQRWREVVCIASGPSLAAEDCEAVQRWRATSRERGVIVTNNTFQMCPWADVLYGLDKGWWSKYLREVRRIFAGERVSPHAIPGVQQEKAWLGREPTNSGTAAIAQAAWWGARRVILLGYDCQHTGGRRHWHGDHPEGLRNADGVALWPDEFAAILPRIAGVEVINASRETALELFPRISLEKALDLPAPATTGVTMKRFSKPFRGVPKGELYPTTFAVGDVCPLELEEAAAALGVLGAAEEKASNPQPPEAPQQPVKPQAQKGGRKTRTA